MVVVGPEVDSVPDSEPDSEPEEAAEDSAASVSGMAVKVPTTEVRVVVPDWSVL